MPRHFCSIFRWLSLLFSLISVQSLMFPNRAIKLHTASFLSEYEEHALVRHEDRPQSQPLPAHVSGMDFSHCHTLSVDNWGFANSIPLRNMTRNSSYASTVSPPNLQTPHLSTRQPDLDPDPSVICNQIAGFTYAGHAIFASTQPLFLLPNRTYVFSMTSSTDIRSIICWSNVYNLVAHEIVHSTKATLQFRLEEPAEVYFTIMWQFAGNSFLGIWPLGLEDPAPAGEVALFVVPGFAPL